jgi:hypothetical protein
VKLLEEVSPKNASQHAIYVHVVNNEPDCKGAQVWVGGPSSIKSALLKISEPQGDDLEAPLAVITLSPDRSLAADDPQPKEGTFAREWTLERRKSFSFLAPGFHGVRFCISPKLMSRTSIELETNVYVFRLAPLEVWK